MAVTLNDIITYKKLIAVGGNEVWCELSAGTMTELDTSSGAIDTTDQLSMFEGYQKAFIVNGANLKVADFANTKITCTALTDNRCPAKGDLLTQDQGSSKYAFMVVDYVNTARTNIYGYAYYSGGATAFLTTANISSNDATGSLDPNPIPNANISAITAPPNWYDWTVFPDVTIDGVVTSYGTMPAKAYLGCLYRGRCVLAGNTNRPFLWYMGEVGNPWNWLYTTSTPLSPIKGGDADVGELGDIIRCLIPYKDDYLLIGCANSIWVLRGDPVFGGSLDEVDLTIGIYGAQSYCYDGDGNLYFWGTGGLYMLPAGFGAIKNLTEMPLPNIITDEAADPSTHRITMGYDRRRGGISIWLTKLSDGSNSCYWYSFASKGFYPESFPDVCGSYSMLYYDANDTDYKDLLVGSKDGYIRKFDDSAKDDDSGASDTAISSYLVYPILKMGEEDDQEGRLISLTFVNAGGASSGTFGDSDGFTYALHIADDAATCLEDIEDGATAFSTGTVTTTGRQNRIRTRIKGRWLGLKISNSTASETWVMDSISGQVKLAGRIK